MRCLVVRHCTEATLFGRPAELWPGQELTLKLDDPKTTETHVAVTNEDGTKVVGTVPRDAVCGQQEHTLWFVSRVRGKNSFDMTAWNFGETRKVDLRNFPVEIRCAADPIAEIVGHAHLYLPAIDQFTAMPGGLGLKQKLAA